MFVFIFLSILSACSAGPTATESYKDQYCTDPRTMRKHAAYTEWADAYSCSRHRCQPGGRNLAIYTVGCKRVEAPESAIECEEVVEDTNMQFPYCCTRLRCLVVVRGEVWTRVLGQPWETLPAAPWSHMYKMKKPPPADGTFLPKSPNEGPIYELQTETEHQEPREKVLRASKKSDDFNEAAPRAAASPDIVIALSTGNDQKEHKKTEISGNRHKHSRKNSNFPYFETATADPDDNDVAARNPVPDIVFALSTNNDQKEHKKVDSERRMHGHKNSPNSGPFFEEEQIREEGHETHDEIEDAPVTTEKTPSDQASDEKYYANAFGVTHKVSAKMPPRSWTEIPQNQWNERDPSMDAENPEHNSHAEAPEAEKKDEKPGNLQALVDAIGTRMRDIESVVQRMSEKVRVKPTIPPELDFASGEKRNQDPDAVLHKHRNEKEHSKERKPKKSSTDAEHYKRFSVRNRGSKYLHSATDSTTDLPLFVEDTNLNGYYSDASNSVLRRVNAPKEPPATYMAPVETRRKTSHSAAEGSEEVEKKRKKHVHKKKRAKGHHKKHHGKDEKRKRFNRLNSVEVDKNVGSLEDSSVAASK